MLNCETKDTQQEQQLLLLDINHDGNVTNDELSGLPTQKLNSSRKEKLGGLFKNSKLPVYISR